MIDRRNKLTAKELTNLIQQGKEHDFYISKEWKRLAESVRRIDRYECQLCKHRGRYRRGEIVHHVKHVKDRPDLALNLYDPDTNARQLITVCKQCHEQCHPEALAKPQGEAKQEITAERWD